MSLSLRLRTVELLVRFLKGELDKVGAYDFVPQKTGILTDERKNTLPASDCEGQGVLSGHIYGLFREFESSAALCPHSLLVMRHGHVIAEGYWSPYRREYTQDTFSFCKTVVGMAVGMAFDEGLLRPEDTVSSIFEDKLSPIKSFFQKEITIENLLTMSAGASFNEVGMALDSDWIKAFINSDILFEPGTQFYYNSLNSYMLAAAITRRAGMSLMDYLTPRLFGPLSITAVSWETCPMGIEKGGWGLRMTTRDMAKLGQLYLQNGVWEGRRILPKGWVEQSTHKHIATGVEGAPYYGYQLWLPEMGNCCLFNGAFGQNVYVLPDADMVIAMTSGSSDFFVAAESNRLIKKYFFTDSQLSDKPLPKNSAENRRLRTLLSRLELFCVSGEEKPAGLLTRIFGSGKKQAIQAPEAASQYGGRVFNFKESFSGIMPLSLQTVHINYARGISSLFFRFTSGGCTLTAIENSHAHIMEIGFDEYRYNTLDFHGELYVVAAKGYWSGKNGQTSLLVRAVFVETPMTRLLTFTFNREKLNVTFEEHPDTGDSIQMLSGLVTSGRQLDQALERALKSEQLMDVYNSFIKPEMESD